MRAKTLVLMLSLCLLPLQALAAQNKPAPVPTNVQAERMRYEAQNQQVVFEGKVHVKRPDFEVWSDKLTVYLDKKNDGAQGAGAMGGMDAGEIDRIMAEGSVRIRQEGRTGTCAKATYTAADGRFTMEGSPLIQDGANQLRGRIIHFYTRDNRSEVIGGVQAEFVTSDRNAAQPGGNGQ